MAEKKKKSTADYIPLVIQIEIFCRLPVKSLIRFRSVSKEWKSLIHSSDFNSDYIVRQAHRQRLLIRYREHVPPERKFCWIVEDDDTFPQNKISLTYPRSVNLLMKRYNFLIVNSSHGLLCFFGYYVGEDDSFYRYVIWNPSIRKSVAIDVLFNWHTSVAFGVCPNSLDPKIVKINTYPVPYHSTYYPHRSGWRVEVFTLSSGVWRSPLIKLPSKWFNIELKSQTPLVINGFIYWCASVGIYYSELIYMIISFDLTSEEFTKIHVPDMLAHNEFDIFKLRESLGVVKTLFNLSKKVHYKVWLMDHVSKSFIELYSTVNLPELSFWTVLGFRDNDQLIFEAGDSYRTPVELVAYEPYSKHFNNLGIYVSCYSSSLTSYTESLLLLDQSDTLNDDEGDAHIARFGDHKS